MLLVRVLAVIVGVCVVAVIGLAALGWRSAFEPIARPQAKSFAAAQIERGAALAAIGNCSTCHTAAPGRVFAGGRGVATPFGTIYSTNITPDEATGIGHWSAAAFRRALREGVDREGRQLYPAFPYDHFTLLSDDDIDALYAFLMTRQPVQASAPPNQLVFPLNVRFVVAGWKLFFFRQGPYQPDPGQNPEFNRGAYLVEGLAHCGACHTPRNALGAEKKRQAFGGGEAEGWTAYALNDASPAPVPWDVDALRFYLRQGWHHSHGIARGPMAPVVDDLASIPDADLQAMTTYLASVLEKPSQQRRQAAENLLERVKSSPSAAGDGRSDARAGAGGDQIKGALIYQSACATCHDSGGPLPFNGINLALSTGPSGPTARNVINVVLWGLPPAPGKRSPIMPGFADVLGDQQLAELLGYVRSHFSAKPAWSDIESDIRAARTNRPAVDVEPAHGTDPAATTGSQHEAQR